MTTVSSEEALEGARDSAGEEDWAADRDSGEAEAVEDASGEALDINRMHMKKKIAVPTSDGVLDPHFGHCRQFALVEVEGDDIKGVTYLDAPPHQPGLLPGWLAERGATDIIAGGMGQRAIQLFNQQGVNVFVGAPIMAPEKAVEGFLNGSLAFSANYCDH